MEINLKEIEPNQVAQKGDLIKFNDSGIIGITLQNNEIALLKHGGGLDFMMLAVGYKDDFEQGKYKIIARANEWEINRIGD